MALIVTFLFLLLVPAAIASDFGLEYERVLVPISITETPGAFGSRWTSELWFRNESGESAAVFPLAQSDFSPPPGRSLPLPVFRASSGHPPGQFLYVTRRLSPDLRFNLRIRDISRADLTWGTEVPVIHEAQFRKSAFSLFPIPLVPGFRSMLRIYEATFVGSVFLRVNIHSLESDTLVAQQTLELSSDAAQLFTPGYAEIVLDTMVNESPFETFRVEIEPLSDRVVFWAFVSVTNNVTQHVTLVTPQ